jgi:DNA adenine methylase
MNKPLLKWAGGKRAIIPQIESLLKDINLEGKTFYDLFFGSGTVGFSLSDHFEKIIMNDTNYELYNLYNVVEKHPEELINLMTNFSKQHSKDFYYNIRAWDREDEFLNNYSEVERAARTLYLNRTCYNGLYRVNSKGQFNVPIGKYKNPKINDFENIRKISRLISEKIKFENHDFQIFSKIVEPGDVVYLDPPYDKNNNSSFTEYTRKRFDYYDQERLRDFVDDLTEKGVYVILSNAATSNIKRLYAEYITKDSFIKVRRSIGSKTTSRIPAEEVLINNFQKVKKNACSN